MLDFEGEMKDQCFLLNGTAKALESAGHEHNGQNAIIVRRNAAIGDAVAATVVSDKLAEIGVPCVFQCHPDIIPVIRRNPYVYAVSPTNGFCHVNLDGCYESDPRRTEKSFPQMFMDAANLQLLSRGIQLGPVRNCKPHIVVTGQESEIVRMHRLKHFPRPWVFVCPRSNHWQARTVPDRIWNEAAKKIPGTKFWLGTHPAPPAFVDLGMRNIEQVAIAMSAADLLVTVDTGPLHIAAAMNIPIVAILQSSSPELHLNDQNDFTCIWPKGLDCLNCQKNICPKSEHTPPCQNMDPDEIAQAAIWKLRQHTHDEVSAVVAIYQPDVNTLNRCLECLIPQVDEIVVTRELKSILPPNSLQHPKIRYVLKREYGIGYGRNQNYGTRLTCNKYLLQCNDDVFLDNNAVELMKREMVDDVGIVACRLHYPDGSIYHAGKYRSPGMRGWGHIDHRKHEWTIKEACRMENVNGAAVLVRRKAFYEINGFDENFWLYAEDDNQCLSMGQAGWGIVYTPHARGVHMEHQSTQKIGNVMDVVKSANSTFGKKWGWYLEKNLNTVPGTF